MIDSLVFDIGNVLVNWNPVPYLMQAIGCDEQEACRINELVFESKAWKNGDRGLADRAGIEKSLIGMHPGDTEKIRKALSICDDVLTEFKDNTKLLEQLKALGFKIYYLSNTNPEAFKYMNRNCGFFKLMDGGIASFKEHVTKPSPEIYNLFLNRYNKKGEDCLFIDDMEINVLAAVKCGMNATKLPSPDMLKSILCKYIEIGDA